MVMMAVARAIVINKNNSDDEIKYNDRGDNLIVGDGDLRVMVLCNDGERDENEDENDVDDAWDHNP